jgi:hypothetical protein
LGYYIHSIPFLTWLPILGVSFVWVPIDIILQRDFRGRKAGMGGEGRGGEGKGGRGVKDMTRLDCGHLLQRTSFLDLFQDQCDKKK